MATERLAGVSGEGKSTLLSLIQRMDDPQAGRILIDGRPDATDEEVYAAARSAHCDDFIRRLPEGYQAIIGERGATLSGGQRQRLGIARAFLKNAPILILDEATAALDSRSEREVQRALDNLVRDRTVIAVAHRLSTLCGFDRIIMLSEGRIVEDGTPAELARSDGLFSSLWQLQAGEAVVNG